MARVRSAPMAVLISLFGVVLLSQAIPVEAGQGGGMPGHGGGGGHSPAPPIVPHGFFGFAHIPNGGNNHFPAHPFPFRRRFYPYIPVGPSVVYSVPYVTSGDYYPSDYYGSGSYDSGYYGSGSYAPPVEPGGAISMSAQPGSTPNVVQFSTGRYELRGDGLTVPYAWVWIPNPPTAPPTGMPGMMPPGMGSFAMPPAGRDRLYRWTDAQGVLHVTDSLDAVPPKYRKQAQSPEPS